MKKTIIEFVVTSIITWSNNYQLGEEIRALRDTVDKIMDEDPDDTIGVILLLIQIYPNDYDLGQQIRKHLISFKLYLNNAS